MKTFINSCIEHNRTTWIALAILLFIGTMSYLNIPKEKNPDVKIPVISVATTLRGISPEDSERLLVKPMESMLRGISGVKEMDSIAVDGMGKIILQFDAGFDSDKALSDVRNKIDDIIAQLPQDAERPMIYEINLSLMPILNLIIYGNSPERELLYVAKQFKKAIEAIPNVLSAEIAGKRDEVVEIIIDPQILSSYNLKLSDIASIVSRSNNLIAAGDFAKTGYSLQINGLLKDVKDIMNLPIKKSGDSVITVKDIAEVRSTFKDATSYARVNGKSALVLEISKRTGKNILETVEQIKHVVEEGKKILPKNINVMYSFDQSQNIFDMLSDLENSIIFAVVLVMIMIMLTMGTRTSVIIAFSIPGSFLIGITIIYYMNFTMNIVVLFALIMSVGMLVDAAIVVNEYADRKMTIGMDSTAAYKMAAIHVFWPVFASTITTKIVFIPLLFWPGVAGQFMKYLPLTLISTLIGSMIVAFVFIPLIGTIFGAPSTTNTIEIERMRAVDEGDIKALGPILKRYYFMLEKVLNNPKTFIFSVIALLVFTISIYSFFGKGVEFFPNVEPESIQVTIRAQGNLSVDNKDEIVKEVESRIFDMQNEIKIFYTYAGTISQPGLPDDTIGKIQIEFVDWRNRRKAQDIINDMKKKIGSLDGVIIDIEKTENGPPQGKPIKINISSSNQEKLVMALDKITSAMKSTKGIINIDDNLSAPEIGWELIVDRAQAMKVGADVTLIGEYVKMLTSGSLLAKYRPDNSDDEIDILARFPEKYRNLDQLNNLFINTNSGITPLNNIVERRAKNKIKTIHRSDSERVITISAGVDSGSLVDEKLKEMMSSLEGADFSDVNIQIKGESEDMKETQKFLLKAFVLSTLFVVFVISMQFNSFYQIFIIMSAIVFSIIGVLLALLITNQAFSVVMCGVAVIALAGTIVNNNILLIDAYNTHINEGMEEREALIRASISRFRPILLTAGTMVMGLIPMVTTIGIDFINRDITYGSPSSQWWQQLSTSLAGGISFATILTSFFTPLLLSLGKGSKKVEHKSKVDVAL